VLDGDMRFLTSLFDQYGHTKWYRHVCALGAVLNILLMMIANLVGFVIGVDGVRYMLQQLTASWQGELCVLISTVLR
jgi:D-alanyl-lipoteichoic acid acyltransferase DltB (MBOAT superfamily)